MPTPSEASSGGHPLKQGTSALPNASNLQGCPPGPFDINSMPSPHKIYKHTHTHTQTHTQCVSLFDFYGFPELCCCTPLRFGVNAKRKRRRRRKAVGLQRIFYLLFISSRSRLCRSRNSLERVAAVLNERTASPEEISGVLLHNNSQHVTRLLGRKCPRKCTRTLMDVTNLATALGAISLRALCEARKWTRGLSSLREGYEKMSL